MSMENKYCVICDKKLTEKEEAALTPYSFCYTCDEHRRYHNVFQIGLVKKLLGMMSEQEFKLKYSTCDICKQSLTDEERNTIQIDHFLITCFFHREFSNVLQVSLIREKLGIIIDEKR